MNQPENNPDLRGALEDIEWRCRPDALGRTAVEATIHDIAQAALAASQEPVVDEVVAFDSIVSEQRDIRFLYKGPTLTVQTRLEGDRLRVAVWKEYG